MHAFEPAFLADTVSDYLDPTRVSLLDRWGALHHWQESRATARLGPDCMTLLDARCPLTEAADRHGNRLTGLNFCGQDPLNLANHPAILAASAEAAQPAGGQTWPPLATQLEQALASFLGFAHATLFPALCAAGFRTVKTLLTATDHCLIDSAAHPCLHDGARASGATLHPTPHLTTDAVQTRLRAIRAANPHAGILVVTETQFALDAGVPDLETLQSLCRTHQATLAVLASHDLGCLGAAGRGQMELQRMTGKLDIVIGALGHAFAATGAFVAGNAPALKTALRHAGAGTAGDADALLPAQAAAALAALTIIRGTEGAGRRARLLRNILHLRERLTAAGFRVLGEPAATLPVHLGDLASSRLATRFAWDQGAFLRLAEPPLVPRRSSRWLCAAMTNHSGPQIALCAEIAAAARKKAANWLSAQALTNDDEATAA